MVQAFGIRKAYGLQAFDRQCHSPQVLKRDPMGFVKPVKRMVLNPSAFSGPRHFSSNHYELLFKIYARETICQDIFWTFVQKK
jgi:hypothetical protein